MKRGLEVAKYIDGFVLVVPKGKEAEYQKMAEMGRDSWMKHGALQYFESRGDDLKQQEMGDQKSRSYAEMTGASGMKMCGSLLSSLVPKNTETR